MQSKKRTRDDFSLAMPTAATAAGATQAWSVQPPPADWGKWDHLASPATAAHFNRLHTQTVGRQNTRPTGRHNAYTPSSDDLAVIRNFKRFKRKGSSSKYKGVFYVKKEKKWRAQICLKGKKQYVGTFTNDRDAAIARDKRIRKLFGEVKELLNFAPPNPVATASIPVQHAYPPHPTMSAHQFQLPTNATTGRRSAERIQSHNDQHGVTMDNLTQFIKPGTMAQLHGGGDPTMIQPPTAYNYVSSAYGLHPTGNQTGNPRPTKRGRETTRSTGGAEYALEQGYHYGGNYTVAS
uniref:AP2/ERF domain-containing protein n=1 Tax=Aplanochytrium stocchinoi TaxID=215587 RepID=A0A7S3LK92_9STRA|mmetsp:Transcript_5325/g.6716  ORF Transcript_5325/g.6716 Transcript_5325/m.6716 type:complete len:293 (-) Transcript_5325:134-1012(-)